MKKFLFALYFLCIHLLVFSQTPEIFKGIWKGQDRYIFMGENNQISIVLKEYYGWYLDRVCEPEHFSEIKERRRNVSTGKKGIEITTSFEKISKSDEIWELTILYGKKSKSTIPLYIEDNKIYLDFLVKIPYSEIQVDSNAYAENEEKNIYGYWQGLNTSDSIQIHERNDIDNIISWYITPQGTYRLRFWETNMKNEDSKAAFSDAAMLYTVNKHIYSAGQNYTCVNGKSSNIRNVEKYQKVPFKYHINEQSSVLTLKGPYLVKLKEAASAQDLLNIVELANSRRKPAPPPLFPEENLDWHWDLINELEKGNEIIQAVRERQKAFGPRAQDIVKKK